MVPDGCFSPAELVRYRLLTAACVQMLLKPTSDGHRQLKGTFGKMVLGGLWQAVAESRRCSSETLLFTCPGR